MLNFQYYSWPVLEHYLNKISWVRIPWILNTTNAATINSWLCFDRSQPAHSFLHQVHARTQTVIFYSYTTLPTSRSFGCCIRTLTTRRIWKLHQLSLWFVSNLTHTADNLSLHSHYTFKLKQRISSLQFLIYLFLASTYCLGWGCTLVLIIVNIWPAVG